jgi:serine/threonine protein kinase/predicted ATPase
MRARRSASELRAGVAVNSTLGRYRLLDRLGQGGMAEVFKAKSFGVEGFEKVLVIKRILPELAQSPEFVEMFIHEAKLAVRLSHANIVQVFDLGLAPAGELDDAPAYYMAMEYVHGFDLATLLARCRRMNVVLPLDMCVYIASEVAKGLDHAHRRRDEQLRPLGIVHRDVSPQNVLLSFEGEVKVTDFGIAKARGVIEPSSTYDTRARKLQGKFGYMSPEQARGDNVDARSDLFSLGVLLYECIAGVNPFSAPTTFETLRRVQASEYPPIELLRQEIPQDLSGVVAMAMRKLPEERYPDAGRMYESMLAFLYREGSRYGAHELATFLQRFRGSVPPQTVVHADRLLEGDRDDNEKTPVEVPSLRAPLQSTEPGRAIDLDRAAEMGERREVTGLVIELPERDVIWASERATSIIGRYGGRVVTRESEYIAAVFGIDEPDGRDTEVATRCGLVTLRALEGSGIPAAPVSAASLSAAGIGDLDPASEPRVGKRRASVGLHAARIHLTADGQATDDERLRSLISTARDYALMRDGRCAISSIAMRQVKGLFELAPLSDGVTSRTGLTGAIVKDVRDPKETFGRFVGRKDELRALAEVLAAATKRQASVFTLRGDHGLGKTRLLHEVDRRLQKGGYNIGFYLATCPPHGRDYPLSGIACMLQVLCGVVEGDPPERVLAVQPRLRALGLQDEDVAAVLNTLGAPVPAANPHAKAALKHAFSRMLASLSEDKPHIFAWDDAHCLDEDSFAVLEAVYTRLAKARLVFTFASRAGFSHPMEIIGRHNILDLGDLRPEDAQALVGARLGIESVPDELQRFVRERAGGHPQFIEELLKALLDSRAITIEQRRIVSMRLLGQEIALPKTLRGLVASRVARISPMERATLQAAAALGEPVEATALARMLGQPMSTVEGSLAALREKSILVHTGPSALRFTSPILREVVMDALTLEASRDMHAAAASALQALVVGEPTGEQAARIAVHLYQAGESELAADYFARSGEERLRARQMESAAQDMARAIELCDVMKRDPAQLARWFESLSQAVRLARHCTDAAALCDRVMARIDEAVDVKTRVSARVAAGTMLAALHEFDRALFHFGEAERVAEGDEKLAKKVLLAYAELAARQGDFNRALAMLERLERIVTGEGDRAEEHKVLLYRAQAHAALGDHRSAVSALDRASATLPEDPTAACERDKFAALVDYFGRDFRAAAARAEQAIDRARALGLMYEVAVNLHNLGDFLVRLEDYPRAYGAIRQSLDLSQEGGFDRLVHHDRMYVAFLDGITGDPRAEERLQSEIEYADDHDYTWDALNGRYLLATLLRRRGEIVRAREEFERALEAAQASGNHLLADDCKQALYVMPTPSVPPPSL